MRIAARPFGFTLVEILVVIAIIAIISAFAFPAFGRSREQANRSKCLNNLRQIHSAMGRFAADNDGTIPVGYRTGKKQFTTTLYSGSIDRYVLLGKLVEAGLVTEPSVFFCPSEADPTQAWNTKENRWPAQPGKNLQGGYASAPLVDWGTEESPPNWPRLANVEHGALLADGFGMPKRVDSRHKDGINVMATDGSAQWVRREKIDSRLAQCKSLGAEANDAQQWIWDTISGRETTR